VDIKSILAMASVLLKLTERFVGIFHCLKKFNAVFQVHIYLNSKCQRSADMRRNPRRVTWTVYYRRKHKKGASEQEIKKRTRRNIKFQRAITGVTWNEILAKRNQQPEFRKAQRQDAIKYDYLNSHLFLKTTFCLLTVRLNKLKRSKLNRRKRHNQLVLK
jgi:large subunit ribosomal protein L24e